jgi:hypothetical protein
MRREIENSLYKKYQYDTYRDQELKKIYQGNSNVDF